MALVPDLLGNQSGVTFKEFVDSIVGLLNTAVVPVIFALAFLSLIWGVLKYFVFNANNETKREEGRRFILWGLVGMAVLFSVWGLVALLLSTLNLGN